jgi:NAD(P)-dependent dehydrogenase (short-subunit alcohol dehydrogenase family)
MDDFGGRLAVVTGAGAGMGRELARQLAEQGCHLAVCDISADTIAETEAVCREVARTGTRVTSHVCDVADEAQMLAFRAAVCERHATDRIHLLFNNAGIGGGGSFLTDSRADWERTFSVSWLGVYLGCRVFMPLLVASDAAHIVNTSSVNGFWASLVPQMPHTAYSAAKFAIKGFTEALLTDLRINAPHVLASVVMPGHVGTEIGANTRKVLGKSKVGEMTVDEVAITRARVAKTGYSIDGLSDDQVRHWVQDRMNEFRDHAPLSAAAAAKIILDGVRQGQWRILVGEDARALDIAVRRTPENAYELSFLDDVAEIMRQAPR